MLIRVQNSHKPTVWYRPPGKRPTPLLQTPMLKFSIESLPLSRFDQATRNPLDDHCVKASCRISLIGPEPNFMGQKKKVGAKDFLCFWPPPSHILTDLIRQHAGMSFPTLHTRVLHAPDPNLLCRHKAYCRRGRMMSH